MRLPWGLGGLHYEAPHHANSIFYTLGGITLGGVVILFITGFYLAQFYDPTPTGARDSVIFIATQVNWGEFVRSVHWWTANLVIITAVLHMARIFITASYKRPRELNWIAGVIMLLLIIGLFFTGTVLKWDQEGYEASTHVVEVGMLAGWIGQLFTSSFAQNISLLTRFSFIHLAILPSILTLFIVLHLLLVKRHGISLLPIRGERSNSSAYEVQKRAKPVTYFDRHLVQLIGFSFLLLALVSIFSLVLPATLGEAVVTGREVTKPPWLFLWLTTLENWWGVKSLLWVGIVVPVILVIVPFVDRTPFLHILNRKWLLAAGIVVVAVFIAVMVIGLMAPIAEHVE